MAKAKRNIGREILEGIQQLTEGSMVASSRCPQSPVFGRRLACRDRDLSTCWVYPCEPFRNGSRAGAPSGAARTLLLIADKNPHTLLDVA